jgi:SAM-dependent methyltransferase
MTPPVEGRTNARDIAEHWATGDVFALITKGFQSAGLALDEVTLDDLAPIDHFHARGLNGTIDLADRLPVEAGHRVLDIGCGLGGPARYLANRFGCTVDGVDLTQPFVEAANKLTTLLGLDDRVRVVQGDACALPFQDEEFHVAYSQHVTMNVADRERFFAEAWRVLKPGGAFGLTEHGLGPAGDPVHPLPWSADGTGAYLLPPERTLALLKQQGFVDLDIQDHGDKYIAGYRKVLDAADRGQLPAVGIHLLLGPNALVKTRNSMGNLEASRTRALQVVCRKPSARATTRHASGRF